MRKVVPPGGDLDDITFDYMVEQGYFWVGSPYTVYEQIRQFYDETGGFGTLLVFAGRPTASHERVLRSMELLMTEVAPRLAQLDPDAKIPAAVS